MGWSEDNGQGGQWEEGMGWAEGAMGLRECKATIMLRAEKAELFRTGLSGARSKLAQCL